MIDSVSLFAYATKYGVGRDISKDKLTTFQVYLEDCRKSVTQRTPKGYMNWDIDKQTRFTENLIISYVEGNERLVEGYYENGIMNINGLITDLKISILDFGVLSRALKDNDIQEIQINDYKTIYVVRGGMLELYTDEKGVPYKFVDDTELQSTIYRMSISETGNSKRMTTEDPLMNTRATKSGYRISGVNNTAITPDKAPFDFPVTSITIRKYNAKRLTFSDFIRSKTMSKEMAKAIEMFSKANTKMFKVGITSSGKTTVLNESAHVVAESGKRIIAIQNPTEIVLYKRDENGTNMYNALHWEANSTHTGEGSETKNTMASLIAHALRNSPDVILTGEARLPEEFREMYRCLLFGQRIMGTFHAEDCVTSIERWATEVATATSSSKKDYIATIAKNVDIVVTQDKLEGGHRRTMEIAEPTGVIDDYGTPEANILFKFEICGNPDKDEEGRVKLIHGKFIQKSVISDRLKSKLMKVGYTEEELRFLTDKSNINKVLLEV